MLLQLQLEAFGSQPAEAYFRGNEEWDGGIIAESPPQSSETS
jgi:hypothetical protein